MKGILGERTGKKILYPKYHRKVTAAGMGFDGRDL
jgi:hypothetical protein